MKLVISLILFINHLIGCELKDNFQYIALSAPVSIILKEMNILDEVEAISSFHPYKEKIKVLSGGIFLKAKSLKLSSKKVLFFDKSKELDKELEGMTFIREEFDSRGKSSLDFAEELLMRISKYTNGCESEVSSIKKDISLVRRKILKAKFNKAFVFFIDSFDSNGKNNSLVVANDGFVLDLKKNSSFKSYPSSLAYVNWSSKILSSIENKIMIGLKGNAKIKAFNKVKNRIFNVMYPAVLIPGMSQVKFLSFFLDKEQYENFK